MFRKFAQSRSGNFAILSGLAIVPLCLAAGLAIDYSRHLSAQRHLQEMVDATSLSLASSREKDKSKLEGLATDFLNASQNSNRVQNLRLEELKSTDDDVDIDVSGSIPTTFMALAGYETLDVRASALAERAINGRVEVALILDNTESMEDAKSGTPRITTLKRAANRLVDELLREDDGAVRIGLIPYGEYVNVGLANRGASWLSVAPDRSETKIEGAREERPGTEPTKWEKVWVPPRDCSTSRDGVWEEKTCPGRWVDEPVEWKDVVLPAEPGKPVTRHYRWHGCVASRTGSDPQLGDNRLHDGSPGTRYVGMVEEHERCLTEIVPLTGNKMSLKAAIDGMVTRRPRHVPLTYIPAGVVWGLNVLSPGEPFAQGAAYDPLNKSPRKVAVLMTDGTNTMKFNSNGRHGNITLGKNNENNAEVITTNADTLAICQNMKRQGIEIFTVAFMVDSPRAKTMLENCSTNASTHAFDASNDEGLLAAFENIGNSLRVVRLAR